MAPPVEIFENFKSMTSIVYWGLLRYGKNVRLFLGIIPDIWGHGFGLGVPISPPEATQRQKIFMSQ